MTEPKTAPSDALLAELNMQTVQVDAPPVQDKTNPLELSPAGAPSAVQSANQKFSTRAGGDGFRVTVCGEYLVPSSEDPKKKVTKDYKLSFNLPNLDKPLSVIKNMLIKPALRKLDPRAARARTIHIVSAVPLTPRTPESRNLQFMPRERLVEHVREVGAPIDVDHPIYADVVNLRDAVIDFTVNPKGFEERQAKKLRKLAEDAEIMKMNPELQTVPDVSDVSDASEAPAPAERAS